MMKHLLSTVLLVMPLLAKAQPSISTSNAMPAAGFSETVLVATGMNFGSSGAGVTWDFSGMSVTPVATFTVMAPSATPHAMTFSSATHSVRLTPLSGTNSFYEYYRQSPNGWEILGSNFTGTSGDNYTPNSKLRIPIPFNYNNSRTDTFQKIGGSLDAYTITYDGYGTLKTPGRTLNDVIRIKYQWIGGEIRYEWFTTSPLFYAATWNSSNGGTFNFLGRTATAGIGELAKDGAAVVLFPNPASGTVHVKTNGVKPTRLIIRDLLGKAVLTQMTAATMSTIDVSALADGVYSVQAYDGEQLLGVTPLVVVQ